MALEGLKMAKEDLVLLSETYFPAEMHQRGFLNSLNRSQPARFPNTGLA